MDSQNLLNERLPPTLPIVYSVQHHIGGTYIYPHNQHFISSYTFASANMCLAKQSDIAHTAELLTFMLIRKISFFHMDK